VFSIDSIKPNVEKKFKTCFIFFMPLFRGGELRAYKIKTALFLYALALLAVTKHYTKERKKGNM
jgi:hypothetical protein